MVTRIDCRGMNCPQPVLKTKELIEEHPQEMVEVVVDNEASRGNVVRFLESRGWEATVRETAEGFLITAAPPTCELTVSGPDGERPAAPRVVVFIPSARLGDGAPELGERLMANFLSTLKELEGLWRVILVNSGVTLTRRGTAIAQELARLEEAGVEVLACGTCLEFYGLTQEKEVGATTNMLDIVTSLSLADKVIRI